MRSLTRLLLRLGPVLLLACPLVARADTAVVAHRVHPQASSALETSHVVPASSSEGGLVLHGASITTTSTAGYFMVIDETADSGNGTVAPLKCVQVASGSTMGLSPDADTSWAFTKGIVLVFSTTGCFTETQSSTAFFSWQ